MLPPIKVNYVSARLNKGIWRSEGRSGKKVPVVIGIMVLLLFGDGQFVLGLYFHEYYESYRVLFHCYSGEVLFFFLPLFS